MIHFLSVKGVVESESDDDSEYYPSNESCSESSDDNDKDEEECKEPPNKSNTSLEINKSTEIPTAGVFDDKDLYIPTSSTSSKNKKKLFSFVKSYIRK